VSEFAYINVLLARKEN